MNYFEIGQNVRKHRRAHDFSQEELAERIGISVTHMSHIETGNTKLSLPVLVKLSRVLAVPTDELLGTAYDARTTCSKELLGLLDGCTEEQARIITDISKAAKIALHLYLK